MTISKTLRTITLFAVVSLAAACQSTTLPVSQSLTDEPVAAQQVDQARADHASLNVIDLRDSFLTSNPESDGLPLLKNGRGGFVLYANGDATFKAFKA